MKQVIVLRHAPKDSSGHLTKEGQALAQKFQGKLGKLDLIISSDMPRAQHTTTLLTNVTPVTDKRAGIPDFTLAQEQELFELGKKHQNGIAGVIFDTPKYRDLVTVRGETLAALIKETLERLPDEGRGLIVSHDGSMVAAEKILQNKPLIKAEKNYKPLEGFIVNEKLEITHISLPNGG